MNSSEFVLFLTIIGVASTSASFTYSTIKLNGTCPRINYITNLNLPGVLGWFYRPYTSFSSPLCYNGNEGQMVFSYPTSAFQVTVAGCCRSAANPSQVTCVPEVGSGSLTATLANPGIFIYEFNGNSYPTFVLDTDYDNFGFMYGCKPGRNNTRDELIFIYTRQYNLKPGLEGRVRQVAAKNNIDFSNAKRSKQGVTVPYIPGPSN